MFIIVTVGSIMLLVQTGCQQSAVRWQTLLVCACVCILSDHVQRMFSICLLFNTSYIYVLNKVHLHIVFVLLYVLFACHSGGVLSCVYIIRSFTYVLRAVI